MGNACDYLELCFRAARLRSLQQYYTAIQLQLEAMFYCLKHGTFEQPLSEKDARGRRICLHFSACFRAHPLKSSNKTALTKAPSSFMCLKTHVCTHRDPLHFCPAYQRKCKGANLSEHMGCIWLWRSAGLSSGGQRRGAEERLPKVLFLADFQHIYII